MSNRFVRHILFLILFVIPGFSGITLFASNISAADTSHVVVRQPDPKFADSYRSQKEFIYTRPPLETNFLKQLWEYLLKQFRILMNITDAMPLIYKILMGGLVIFSLFIAITKTRLYRIFYSDKEIESPGYEFANTVDSSIDFDEAIRSQMAQQQYRLAIRLLYLKVISQLRLKEYIHFSKEKTNVDYLRDLTGEDLRTRFYAITTIYNHVWYGDIEITEDQFIRFEKSFQSFYTAIDVQK
jgi:hypothetical protein